MIDFHCDSLTELYNHKKKSLLQNDLAIDIEKLKKAGSFAQFFACFIDMSKFSGEKRSEQGFLYARNLIKFAKAQLNAQSSEIRLALSCEDFQKNLKNNKISAFLTVEEGGIIGEDISRINELYSNGIRLITLCWNYENSIGYPSCKSPKMMQKGLKEFGFSAVEKMNEMGIIIDVSHLSEGGFFDVISHSKKPVIASHSSAFGLCPHPRNLTDEMIKKLSENGGVCGVNFYPFFLNLSGKSSVKTLAEHIVYMMKVGGEDFVCLGSDFDGFSPPLEGLKNIGEIGSLFDELKNRKITERQIEKIKFSNAERIIKELL